MKYVEITYRYEDQPMREHADPADAAAARGRLEEGNRAFASLLANLGRADGEARRVIRVDPRDLGLLSGKATAPEQSPYAAVLGCSDARVPIELIFNEGPNDLFVVRVAGNALGDDVLASMRYAVDHLRESLKLAVVLGHSGCGAVTSAVDVFLDPANYLSLARVQTLRSLLDRLLIVVHASAKRIVALHGADVVSRPGYRQALIETSIVANAALGAHTLQAALDDVPGIRTAYGVYLIDSREVWAPRAGGNAGGGLAEPPRDAEAFVQLAREAVTSPRIASMLAMR
jgi:carbonic anhydrase